MCKSVEWVLNPIKNAYKVIAHLFNSTSRMQIEKYERQKERSKKISELLKYVNNTENIHKMKRYCDTGEIYSFNCANELTNQIYEYLQTVSSPRPAKEEKLKEMTKNFCQFCDNLALQTTVIDKDSFTKLFRSYNELRQLYIELLFDDLKRIQSPLQPSANNEKHN